MHCKRWPSVFLLVAALLSWARPAVGATDLAASESEKGYPISQAGSGGQDTPYKFFLPLVAASSSTVACDHTIGLNTVVADTRYSYSAVRPGDIVCIAAGNRADLALRNFQGTPGNPITFVNFGGQVVIDSGITHGILVQNSRFFRLTGTGSRDIDYGIKIVGSRGDGINVGYRSSDFEVDHIEITGTGGGAITAKTRAVCSDGSSNDYDYDADGVKRGDLDDVVNRDNFTQYNSVFHDNYIHNVSTVGFYVGSSFYKEGKQLSCSSGAETVYDPEVKGVRIYNNLLVDMGRDGIQVGSATQDCEIHHNRIFRDSQADVRYQQSGVMNNPGSVCNIYNNFIKDGGGPGIYIQGNGGNIVYNNVIVNAGQNQSVGSYSGNGISIFRGSNPGNDIYVLHNTIVRPRNFGVMLASDVGSNHRIQNNIIVEPGNYQTHSGSAYVQTGGRTNVVVARNFTTQILEAAKFKNPTADDYSIEWNSPAVDLGVEPAFGMVPVDYVGRARPQGDRYDAGAYECEFPPRP